VECGGVLRECEHADIVGRVVVVEWGSVEEFKEGVEEVEGMEGLVGVHCIIGIAISAAIA
jgi:hypothetical protein